MAQRILTTVFIAILYIAFSVQHIPQTHSGEAASKVRGASLKTTLLSGKMIAETPTGVLNNFEAGTRPISAVALYDAQEQSWTFSGRVVELKDVSIYGVPGRLVRIEYLRRE